MRHVVMFLYCWMILSVAACSPHRAAVVEPPRTLPGSYDASVEEEAPGAWSTPWWRLCPDPGLHQVVETAVSHNLDIKSGLARLMAARAAARQARASLFPELAASYNRTRAKQQGFFGAFTGTSYQASLAASYELDLWRRAASGAEAAALEANATRFDLESLVMGVSAQAGELYFLLASLEEQIRLNEKLVDILEQEAALLEERYIYGLTSADLFLDARKRAEVARQTLIETRRQRSEVRNSLFLLTGGELDSIPPASTQFPYLRPSLGLPSTLLQYRPDVRAAYLRVKAADWRVAQAVAARFPSVNLLGEWGRSRAATSFGDIVGAFWSAALSAAVTVLDGGRKAAVVEEARANTMMALAAYHHAVLSAFKDVEDALAQYDAQQMSEESLASEEAALEQIASLLEDRYRNGLASYEDVLRAKGQLATVELALARVKYNIAAAIISIYRAIGGAWMADYIDAGGKMALNGQQDGERDGS